MARYTRITTPLPAAKPLMRDAMDRLTPDLRSGDFAQAVMDLGATICTARSPSCLLCPWAPNCAGRDIAAELPIKPPKAKRPERYAHAFVTTDGSCVEMERRPPHGLLGGMLSVPMSEMTDTPQPPPRRMRDARRTGDITHVFTHFRLTVTVWHIQQTPMAGATPLDEAKAAAPTLMRKILNSVVPG